MPRRTVPGWTGPGRRWGAPYPPPPPAPLLDWRLYAASPLQPALSTLPPVPPIPHTQGMANPIVSIQQDKSNIPGYLYQYLLSLQHCQCPELPSECLWCMHPLEGVPSIDTARRCSRCGRRRRRRRGGRAICSGGLRFPPSLDGRDSGRCAALLLLRRGLDLGFARLASRSLGFAEFAFSGVVSSSVKGSKGTAF